MIPFRGDRDEHLLKEVFINIDSLNSQLIFRLTPIQIQLVSILLTPII